MTEPCSLVIFGSTGNLARNKLLPALYHLESAEKLSPATRILGFGRREWSDSDWRDELAGTLANRVRGAVDDTVLERLAHRLHFVPGDLTDAEAYVRFGSDCVMILACRQTWSSTYRSPLDITVKSLTNCPHRGCMNRT